MSQTQKGTSQKSEDATRNHKKFIVNVKLNISANKGLFKKNYVWIALTLATTRVEKEKKICPAVPRVFKPKYLALLDFKNPFVKEV